MKKNDPRITDMRSKKWFQGVAVGKAVGLSFWLAVSNITLLLVVVFLINREREFIYFAVDEELRLVALTGEDRPVLTAQRLLNWATDAVTKATTVSFSTYREDLSEARRNFTPASWDGYLGALQSSGNLDFIINNRLNWVSVPSQAPVIVEQGFVNGNYQWVVEMPLAVTYESASERQAQNQIARVTIGRADVLKYPTGVVILQLNLVNG